MRIIKFSAVGAVGIAVQVAAFASLTHLHLHYLMATIGAVESAVLHNFCWHQRFTWRDRRACDLWTRLGRFHLSNAAISLIGNVAMMRLLLGALQMRAITANFIAIAICDAGELSGQ